MLQGSYVLRNMMSSCVEQLDLDVPILGHADSRFSVLGLPIP